MSGRRNIIKNDYDDYLGTGLPLKWQDDIRAAIGRYLYRAGGDRFVGAQTVVTNYQIVGQTSLEEDALSILGLTGFEAGGVGAIVYHDSRDVQDAPRRGCSPCVRRSAKQSMDRECTAIGPCAGPAARLHDG